MYNASFSSVWPQHTITTFTEICLGRREEPPLCSVSSAQGTDTGEFHSERINTKWKNRSRLPERTVTLCPAHRRQSSQILQALFTHKRDWESFFVEYNGCLHISEMSHVLAFRINFLSLNNTLVVQIVTLNVFPIKLIQRYIYRPIYIFFFGTKYFILKVRSGTIYRWVSFWERKSVRKYERHVSRKGHTSIPRVKKKSELTRAGRSAKSISCPYQCTSLCPRDWGEGVCGN